MFKNLAIRNFRGLGDLEIPRLGRINLVTGKNNSGKTSLLEALFLLCGAGNPQLALATNIVRGIELAGGLGIPGMFWKQLFTDMDRTKTVEIKGDSTSHGRWILHVMLHRPDTIQIPFDRSGRMAERAVWPGESNLKFSFKKGAEPLVERNMRFEDGDLQVEQPVKPAPFQAVFLSSRTAKLQDDARFLGQLRQRKQGEFVTDALRRVEPRLRSIEVNSASGVPMIWGDIGLSELIPLPMMGEGMTRIARMILAISRSPGGVVLVDEVENGIHYSVLGKVWGAVGEAARQFDTQIVAATHSFECMEAAHRSLDEQDLLVHRLEAIDETIRCVTLEADEIKATVEYNLEIR